MLLYGSQRTEKVGVRIMLLTHAYRVVSVQLAMKANLLPPTPIVVVVVVVHAREIQRPAAERVWPPVAALLFRSRIVVMTQINRSVLDHRQTGGCREGCGCASRSGKGRRKGFFLVTRTLIQSSLTSIGLRLSAPSALGVRVFISMVDRRSSDRDPRFSSAIGYNWFGRMGGVHLGQWE